MAPSLKCGVRGSEVAKLGLSATKPPIIAPPVDPNWRIPDSIPAEWRQQLAEEPPDQW
jgi:hypothetical protein